MISGLALALGGGAARGIAHIGVLQELQSHGISPTIITGTSSGALVGSLAAGEVSVKLMTRLAYRLRWHHLTKVSISGRGAVSLAPVATTVNLLLRERKFSDLRLQLGVVATDLITGDEVVFTKGDVGKAVEASCAIPGIFRPVRYGDKLLVDGGIRQDVPVRAARDMGAEIVIAVCLHHELAQGQQPFNPVRTTIRALEIMTQSIAAGDIASADIVIAPDVAHVNPADLKRVDDLIAQGRKATQDAMPEIKRLIGQGRG